MMMMMLMTYSRQRGMCIIS